MKILDTLKDWYLGAKEIVETTRVEILAGALVGAIAGGIYSANLESRTRTIPLAFSELSQMERDAEIKKNPLDSFTKFYARVNDATMKVFESENTAKASSTIDLNNKFAFELEVHYDRALNWHKHALDKLLQEIPACARDAMNAFRDFQEVAQLAAKTRGLLEKTWDDSHVDHDRIEVYTETEHYTDSDGNSHSETVTKTRPVYDHTTHTYDYNPQFGEQASRELDNLFKRYPQLRNDIKLRLPSKTNAENEDAIETSRKANLKGKRLGIDQLFSMACNWNSGSTLNVNLPPIYSNFKNLKNDSDIWRSTKSQAHDDSYNTGSRSDSGPREYQVVETAIEHVNGLSNPILEILNTINKTTQIAPELESKIKAFVAVANHERPGNASRLRREIMGLTKELYNSNFKGGVDIGTIRAGVVVLGILGGVAGLGLLGWGFDEWGNRRRRKRRDLYGADSDDVSREQPMQERNSFQMRHPRISQIVYRNRDTYLK